MGQGISTALTASRGTNLDNAIEIMVELHRMYKMLKPYLENDAEKAVDTVLNRVEKKLDDNEKDSFIERRIKKYIRKKIMKKAREETKKAVAKGVRAGKKELKAALGKIGKKGVSKAGIRGAEEAAIKSAEKAAAQTASKTMQKSAGKIAKLSARKAACKAGARAVGVKALKKVAPKATAKLAGLGSKAIPVVGEVVMVADAAYQIYHTKKEYVEQKNNFLKWPPEKQTEFVKQKPADSFMLFKQMNKREKAALEKSNPACMKAYDKVGFKEGLQGSLMPFGDVFKKFACLDVVGDGQELLGGEAGAFTNTMEDRVKQFEQGYEKKHGKEKAKNQVAPKHDKEVVRHKMGDLRHNKGLANPAVLAPQQRQGVYGYVNPALKK